MTASPEVASTSPEAANPRWLRYARTSLEGVTIYRAQSDAELRTIAELRRAGFGRTAGEDAAIDWLDASDHEPGSVLLLALSRTGIPIGTMRVQDGRCGPVELERRVPLHSLLPPGQRPLAQFGRLSVTRHVDSQDAMFALFKAAWRWCLANGLRSMVIATPPWARAIYEFSCFADLGPAGRFCHELTGGAEHVSMWLDVQAAASVWRARSHPLATAFIDDEHPRISAELRKVEVS